MTFNYLFNATRKIGKLVSDQTYKHTFYFFKKMVILHTSITGIDGKRDKSIYQELLPSLPYIFF